MQGVAVPEPLAPLAEELREDGRRNWVLHLNEMAVEAMRLGDRELAARALDEAILEINAVFEDSPEGRRARSLFFDEDSKLFKGDPYERSMTFFYRGVLYMQEGDWPNARASFRSALYQDQFVEEDQNAADWAIFHYLIAVCETQLGNRVRAEESMERAREALAGRAEPYAQLPGQVWRGPQELPPLSSEHNLLVLVQDGGAPQKYRVGEYGQFQAVRRGAPASFSARVETCGETVAAFWLDSVYYQAATRGGRWFDRLAERKVVAMEAGRVTGTIGIYSGLFVLANARQEGEFLVGLGLLAGGLAANGFAALVGARADVRDWDNLPDALAAAPARVCSGVESVAVVVGRRRLVEMVRIPPPGEGLAVVLAFGDGGLLQPDARYERNDS